MKHRTNFIEEQAKVLWTEYLAPHGSMQETIKKAIELGMQNSDLVDEDYYTFFISSTESGKFRYSIQNSESVVTQSGYIFKNYSDARDAAITHRH